MHTPLTPAARHALRAFAENLNRNVTLPAPSAAVAELHDAGILRQPRGSLAAHELTPLGAVVLFRLLAERANLSPSAMVALVDDAGRLLSPASDASRPRPAGMLGLRDMMHRRPLWPSQETVRVNLEGERLPREARIVRVATREDFVEEFGDAELLEAERLALAAGGYLRVQLVGGSAERVVHCSALVEETEARACACRHPVRRGREVSRAAAGRGEGTFTVCRDCGEVKYPAEPWRAATKLEAMAIMAEVHGFDLGDEARHAVAAAIDPNASQLRAR